MNTQGMINEWKKGCSCSPDNPSGCAECTEALVAAIEKQLYLERRACFEAGFEKAGGDWYAAEIESAIWGGKE